MLSLLALVAFFDPCFDLGFGLRDLLQPPLAPCQLVRNIGLIGSLGLRQKLRHLRLQLRLNLARVLIEQRPDVTQVRFCWGMASRSDVARAELQLASTERQMMNLDIQRAQLEHAIALLAGKMPKEFSIARKGGLPDPPEVAVAIPSAFLE